MKNKLNSNQQLKRKLRASKEWKDLRSILKDVYVNDPVTKKPLSKSFNLHHLSQSKEIDDYYNLDPSRFCCVNAQTHDVVHYLYRSCRDHLDESLQALKNIVNLMIALTKADEDRRAKE